ncbi:diflavin oxidoreductase [Blattabacterium cuenoti]|uniref:diflavin oxidoreductase n=1 Tax=Blattabacterium cuenoti TaxID=1653831 RepID=UPI001EEAE291|nr:flavodoxin domain-containing protein [Blattabacterium cuenoti]
MLTNNKIFIDLIKKSSKEDIIWMYGYISGFLCNFLNLENKIEKNIITLVYSSETGNAENLAFYMFNKMKKEKLNIRLFDLNDYCLFELERESYLLIIMSTYGDGDPPSSGKDFFYFIHNKNIELNKLRYSVLALGDKSYVNFCKAGEDVDKRLEYLGSTKILDLYKCDTDYKKKSEYWINNIIYFFKKNIENSKKNIENSKKNIENSKKNIENSKKNIENGIILNNKILNKNKNRKIHHIEIYNISNKEYLPGDSIGIYPENNFEDIKKIMSIFNLNDINKYNSIFYSLKKNKKIYNLSEKFLNNYSQLFKIDKKKIFYKKNWDIIDLLKKFHNNKNLSLLKNLINIMESITPRLYSISSSPKKHINEIHITVLLVQKKIELQKNKIKYGHCSNFLINLKKGDKISFFIHRNKLFKLPNNNSNIIMIGPGTGIAPFRSFLYEREYVKASGKNWLFFGDQNYNFDFLYKNEIEKWIKNGVLYNASISFSRDQEKKIYVQDKIWENKEEFFYWIKNGAYIYICGKKTPMSVDVENTINRIIEKVGKEDPISFMINMKINKRYLKDVY